MTAPAARVSSQGMQTLFVPSRSTTREVAERCAAGLRDSPANLTGASFVEVVAEIVSPEWRQVYLHTDSRTAAETLLRELAEDLSRELPLLGVYHHDGDVVLIYPWYEGTSLGRLALGVCDSGPDAPEDLDAASLPERLRSALGSLAEEARRGVQAFGEASDPWRAFRERVLEVPTPSPRADAYRVLVTGRLPPPRRDLN